MTDSVLFAPIEPFHHQMLSVGGGHQLYVEQCGNPSGLPVVFLHGGPAGGSSARHRRFFDPAVYHIVLFDQRGCGRSLPVGEVANNTTPDLVSDIETIRVALGIDRWLVSGGSWGATLALAYAAKHSQSVLGLILRAVFLADSQDLDWFFVHARQFSPDAWQSFADALGVRQADDLQDAILASFVGDGGSAAGDSAQAHITAAHWFAWDMTLMGSGGKPIPAVPARLNEREFQQYRLHAAYMRRAYDLSPGAILGAAASLAGVPTAIVHGRLDWVCRPINGWRVADAIPGAKLCLLERAGHSAFDRAMAQKLVAAATAFASTRDFAALGDDWRNNGELPA